MKKLLVSILLVMVGIMAYAQEQTLSTKNKKATKLFNEAKSAYQFGKEDDALKPLLEALKEDSNFIEDYMLLGQIYIDINKPENALKYLNKAVAINPNFFPTIFYSIGKLDLELGKYDDGVTNLQRFNHYATSDPQIKTDAARTLADCIFGAEAIKHPVPFEPKNMGPAINSDLWEYFPTYTGDGLMMMFTRRMVDEELEEGFQEDIYESFKVNGQWTTAINAGPPLNTPHFNEGAPTISADGKLLIFASHRPGGFGSEDLYVSRKHGNQWSEGINLGRPINSSNWESQPCLSTDGRSLYFVRGDKHESPNSMDIYVSEVSDSGTLSVPLRLSDSINTPYMDSYPFMSADNQTLYFCSSGHVGMGGMDIFLSRRKPDGSWGTAKNLGYPINTADDETSIVVDPNGQLAYFSSDKPGGYGGQDLYQFLLYNAARPAPVTYMKGKVYDSKSTEPISSANFSLIDLSSKATIMQSTSMIDGTFMVCIPLHKNYALNVAKKGYLFYSENFELQDSNATSVHPYTINIPLQPIDTGATIILKNIFFATNKYDLQPESQVELDKLVTFLQVNPTVKIEVSGHTDNVGTPQSNMTLSNNRAKSVYDYLVAHSIAADRLKYKGYGQTRPIADNTSTNGRALNRRTEMKITAK